MADAVLYDIATEIIKILSSEALKQVGIWRGVKDEIKKLENTVSTIQAVLLDAERRQPQEEQIKVWLRQLQDVVYDADDLLDDFHTEALLRKVKSGHKMTKQVRLFFSRPKQIVYGYKMGVKIKEIRERLDNIAKDRERFHLKSGLVPETPLRRPKTHSFVGEGEVIGRDEDKKAIWELLMDSNTLENILIIPIVGFGGLGKTTLAQFVYNDERAKNHFELKMWVCVSDPFDVKLIVEKILKSITDKNPKNLELDQLQRQLRGKIAGKKYLLVLDDIWNEDRNLWLQLERLLMSGASGSRIIITTRFEMVAKITSKSPPYVLKGLPLDKSWSLFKELIFGKEKPKTYSENIGREIVRKCAGVPLVIKTIGGLLYTKDPGTWQLFTDNEFSIISENDIVPTLKLSYNSLLPHLKHCFTYCSLFPKNYEFDVKTLIQLWIAQGFVKSSNTSRCLEKLGLGYFEDLLWRSFFQEVEYDDFGGIKCCKMHDLMHDLAISVAGPESTISNPGADNIGEKIRHVSVGFEIGSSWVVPPHFYKATKLRSFLLPKQLVRSNEQWIPDLEAVFSNFRHLRVSDLKTSKVEEVPNAIKKLKHLRYVDFSGSTISVLPRSISQLQNLQVLKLNGCERLKALPVGITKLLNLRHLDCEGCGSLTHMPRGIGKLTSLQILTYFVVAEDKSVQQKAGRLEELKGLNGLTGCLTIGRLHCVRSPKLESEAANLKEKQHLQSLTLCWDKSGSHSDTDNEEESLESLQPHSNIKELIINYYGGLKFPPWFSSLTNLVNLSLWSGANCKHLPHLSQIPSLKELIIRDCPKLEYIEGLSGTSGQGGVGRSTFFPSLKTLWLENCPELRGWWKKDDDDAGAESITVLPQFSCLSKLIIYYCPLLTWMPLFPSLEDALTLNNVSLKLLQQTMNSNMAASALSSSSSIPLSSPSSSSNSIFQPLSKLKNLELEKIDELESLPEEWLKNLISLEELRISNCPNCKHLPHFSQIPSLKHLEIEAFPKLEYIDWKDDDSLSGASGQGGEGRSTFFPSLKTLWLDNCPELRGWWEKDDGGAGAESITALPQFSCLSTLYISDCPLLTWMPVFPSLDDTLGLFNVSLTLLQQIMNTDMTALASSSSSIPLSSPSSSSNSIFQPLSKLQCLELEKIDELESLPEEWLKNLISLEDLQIRNCPKLEYIEVRDDYSLSGASGQGREGRSTFFPSLKILEIEECPELRGWWKKDDAGAESITVLPQFSCLSTLKIEDCPLLTWMPPFPSLDETLYLNNVSLKLLQQIMNTNMAALALSSSSTTPSSSSKSIFQPLSKLKCLKLRKIDELESLPEEWLKNLISLQIEDCGQLRSLPWGIQRLTTLSIINCPLLTEKCGNNKR